MKKFFTYLCTKLRKFEEIIYFVEPMPANIIINSANNNPNLDSESNDRLHIFDDYIKVINNYRNIMRNNKNMRMVNNQYFNRLI